MLAEEIRKTSFETLSLNTERAKLATDARDILGYKRLALATCTPGALLYQMRELSINPLDADDVELYKTSKVSIGMWSNEKRMWAWLAAFLVSVPLGSSLIYHCAHGKTTALNIIGITFPMMLILHTLVRFCCNVDGNQSGTRKSTQWYSINIKDYSRFIPEHVVSKAVQIGKVLPNARFEIDYLATTTEVGAKPIPDPDPFLRVTLPSTGECYFIDVWQEREFELYIEDKL